MGSMLRPTKKAWQRTALVVAFLHLVVCEQFHPNRSTTFTNEEQLFKVEYLDNASLTGFVAEDVVQLGDFYVSTRFGCVTKSKGHDWAEADGILGMGFPAAALRSVPFPLFWALTDPSRASQAQSNVLQDRIFTLMLSDDRGELVLGGHDPLSVQGGMVTTPVRASPLADGEAAYMHYMIDVQSLKVGGFELLQFRDKSIAIQAILDSGTSCLVVPDDTFDGGLLESPFKTFQKHFGDLDEPLITITVEGKEFTLPYDDYMVDDKPCVMKMKSTPRTFLLGDVFFRRMVVVHDLRDPMKPLITLGQRVPSYELTTELKTISGRSHIPLGKKQVQKPTPETEPAVPDEEAPAAAAGEEDEGAYAPPAAAAAAAAAAPRQGQGSLRTSARQGLAGGGPGRGPAQYSSNEGQPLVSAWGSQGGPEPVQPPAAARAGAQRPPRAEGMRIRRPAAPAGGEAYPNAQPPPPYAAAAPAGYPQYPPRYSAPPAGGYGAPPAGGYGAPPAGGFGAPPAAYGVPAAPYQQQPPQYQYSQAPAGYEPYSGGYGPAAAQVVPPEEPEESEPMHRSGRRLMAVSEAVQRVPMTTSNSYIYYAQLSVGTPRQKNIHVILDTGSSVFAIFAVPHGGPSLLVMGLLTAACLLGATSIGLLILSWYQGQYEEEQLAAAAGGVEQDPLLTGPGAAHRAGDLTQLAGDD